MKSILQLAFVFTFCMGYSQARVTSTAISMQGIAKDSNNAAIANTSSLESTFEIYFLGESNSEELILRETITLATDAFGIFQTVFTIPENVFYKIGNTEAYLKITSNDVIFANEKLSVSPYAIYAQNGYMTGTIVAFVGTNSLGVDQGGDIPEGWLYCDGSTIPTGSEYDNLRTLLGTTTVPDLEGWMLRGSGTNGNNDDYVGPALGVTQGSGFESHLHSITNLVADDDGSHFHDLEMYNWQSYGNPEAGQNDEWYKIVADDHPNVSYESGLINDAGDHDHSLTGNTQTQLGNTNQWSGGPTYVRPVSYGVRYIIKI